MHREAQSVKWGWATRKREGADRVARVRYSRDEPAFQKILLTFDSSRAIQLKKARGGWINMGQGMKRDMNGQVMELASTSEAAPFRKPGEEGSRRSSDSGTGAHARSRLRPTKRGLPQPVFAWCGWTLPVVS